MSVVKKDPYIEKVFALMNESLIETEENLIDNFTSPELPIILVIGVQRSGTTVLTQALVSLFNLSYPTNLIARFWRAPYIGAMLNHSLRINDEKMLYSSTFGATSNVSGPHEFSYFWRHWFPESATNALPWMLSGQQQDLLRKHFAAWQSVRNEPLLFKNLLEVIPNIENLSTIFPTAVFLNIIRDDFFVIQSTYESKKNYGEEYKSWFGIKPKNYREIMEIDDPLIQSTEQVFYLKRDIAGSLSQIPKDRYLNIAYEDFMSSPEKIIGEIATKIKINPWRRSDREHHDLNLESGNKVRLQKDQINIIKSHLKYLKEAKNYE